MSTTTTSRQTRKLLIMAMCLLLIQLLPATFGKERRLSRNTKKIRGYGEEFLRHPGHQFGPLESDVKEKYKKKKNTDDLDHEYDDDEVLDENYYNSQDSSDMQYPSTNSSTSKTTTTSSSRSSSSKGSSRDDATPPVNSPSRSPVERHPDSEDTFPTSAPTSKLHEPGGVDTSRDEPVVGTDDDDIERQPPTDPPISDPATPSISPPTPTSTPPPPAPTPVGSPTITPPTEPTPTQPGGSNNSNGGNPGPGVQNGSPTLAPVSAAVSTKGRAISTTIYGIQLCLYLSLFCVALA